MFSALWLTPIIGLVYRNKAESEFSSLECLPSRPPRPARAYTGEARKFDSNTGMSYQKGIYGVASSVGPHGCGAS